MEGPVAPDGVGLCRDCVHARAVESARGSEFWRCGYHDVDATFPKYPRLPVLACSAVEHRPSERD